MLGLHLVFPDAYTFNNWLYNVILGEFTHCRIRPDFSDGLLFVMTPINISSCSINTGLIFRPQCQPMREASEAPEASCGCRLWPEGNRSTFSARHPAPLSWRKTKSVFFDTCA